MAPLHVATLTVQRELPKYEYLGSLPYLCTKNETMAPLHVAITVQRELPKYEIIFSIQGIYPTSAPRMKPWLHFMWAH